jgi:hypothetical protein
MTIERHKRNSLGTDIVITEEIIDDGLSIGMPSMTQMQNNSMIIDSETFSIDERSEVRLNGKRQWERSTERSFDGGPHGMNGGPITRRKEHQMSQSNGKGSYYEKSVSELTTLKKFDDFYKERKNVENEMYLWRAPRVSKDLFQVPVDNFDIQKRNNQEIINFQINSKEEVVNPVRSDMLFPSHSKGKIFTYI